MANFGRALSQIRPLLQSPLKTDNEGQQPLFQTSGQPLSIGKQLQFLRAGSTRLSSTLERPATSLPDGVEEVTRFGRHYAVRGIYDDSYYHGRVRLARFDCADLHRLMTVMREKGTVPDRNAIVFLDTETTGVQGGTGMCPFLVGLGFFVDDDYHMLQYFIRDFDEEPSMLCAIQQLLSRFELVVTYNGRAFDIPLLEARFTLARLDSPFADISHLDLLTSARRLWRNAHGSCRLVALEREIVSFHRGPDVPGSVIPRAYFEYLQRRASVLLPQVFTHNVYDVVSLTALAISACDRVVLPPASLDDPLDIYSLARILENTADWKQSIALYGSALSAGLPEALRRRARESLAVLLRRNGDYDPALEVCRQLIADARFSLTGYEGVAIHYERVAGDPSRALEIVEHGLARLGGLHENRRWRLLLQARRDRLRQKILRF